MQLLRYQRDCAAAIASSWYTTLAAAILSASLMGEKDSNVLQWQLKTCCSA